MKISNFLFTISLLVITIFSNAQQIAIIPEPFQMKVGNGSYTLPKIIAINAPSSANEISELISLQHFPLRTNPFWNMKHGTNGIFNKVDVILYGQETIGSAERSCDVEKMREMFYTIENGGYCAKLFELFGKERVEKELEEFLSMEFFLRKYSWRNESNLPSTIL